MSDSSMNSAHNQQLPSSAAASPIKRHSLDCPICIKRNNTKRWRNFADGTRQCYKCYRPEMRSLEEQQPAATAEEEPPAKRQRSERIAVAEAQSAANHMLLYYWCLIAPTEDSVAVADLTLELRTLMRQGQSKMQTIDGKTRQGAVELVTSKYKAHRLAIAAIRAKIKPLWKKVVDDAAKEAGVPLRRYIVDLKILAAAVGKNGQRVHWDGKLGSNGYDNLSFILYAQDCDSTAMPDFPGANSPSAPHQPPAQRIKQLRMLNPVNFSSTPVAKGTMAVFRQSVPHFGVKNKRKEERVVLFDMSSDSKNKAQDDYTHHVGQWVWEARRELRQERSRIKSVV